MQWFRSSLKKSWFLGSLIVVNFLGTIYGFYWYKNQLAQTEPALLRVFVPDSPAASGLFTLFLIALWLGRSFPSLEAFAAVTNLKYGVWAVAVIIWGWALGGERQWTDYMLIFSHGGMAFESLLYARFYTIRFIHLLPVAIWLVWNDAMDYLVGLHPWLPSVMYPSHVSTVGWFTFLLTVLSLTIIYLVVRPKKGV
ncbi:hypothetical protein BEP19_01985 [Ammoniphilus oxalaticus]|uniref:DUF1405 domain-containing protein n=1 Tax=Ammoniphilus oxalaticus TaxID=66863 RepID=A0A419SP03_9BACL|nr:DUF1405 domain-containing protein [Ammoniphilus oxalaticus]RKD26040.1 hypothetical protein BEP19_01985 [Ammoniphilus oxalaticus]